MSDIYGKFRPVAPNSHAGITVVDATASTQTSTIEGTPQALVIHAVATSTILFAPDTTVVVTASNGIPLAAGEKIEVTVPSYAPVLQVLLGGNVRYWKA